MYKYLFSLILVAVMSSAAAAQACLDISGEWLFGGTTPVRLPGTTDDARLGEPNRLGPAMAKPQLTHLTRRHYFMGEARYLRHVDIPKAMAGRPLRVTFERVLWRSRLFVDGRDMGQSQESLVSPHVYTIPRGLDEGAHEIELRVDNSKQYDISYNEMCHAYTDETQIKWNGVLGRMEITALADVEIASLDVYPDVAGRRIRVAARLSKHGGGRAKGVLTLGVRQLSTGCRLPVKSLRVALPDSATDVTAWYDMGDDVRLWSEFDPTLYELTAEYDGGGIHAGRNVTFGMREIGSEGGRLLVNGRRTFLRGTLECCVFPLTGTPPTTEDGWLKVFATARDWGLNHLRFHSYCPPEAAFRVADRMGFYLQVELPCWSLNIGRDKAVELFLRREFDNIVANYGNHPSLCLVSCGNELQSDFTVLNSMVRDMKQKDPRHLYSTTTFTFERGHGGHPEPEDQFFVTQRTDSGWVRGQGVFDAERPSFEKDYAASVGTPSVPLISHEIGQYAVYPNVREIEKYTGVLDPLNFKAVRDDLRDKGLLKLADDFFDASGRFAAILYKEEVERALKTPGFSGFQLLGLQDFPGQSTALVGLVDAFWDNKGFMSPADFHCFCAPVVPLARYGKAVYTTDETFDAAVEVANYGREAIAGGRLVWTLADDLGRTVGSGATDCGTIAQGGLTALGRVKVDLGGVAGPCRLTLRVALDGTPWRNSWHIWVYPATAGLDCGDVVLTADCDEAARALAKGRKVLFSPAENHLKGLEGKFVPVFWSPVHFPKQAGTMGVLCNPSHPALASFPTESHSDWQWWGLMKDSKVLVTDSLRDVVPIVSVIDNFANNRRLAAAIEARCGGGRLLFTSMNLIEKMDSCPEARQMVVSLLRYMNSADFAPAAEMTVGELRSFISATDNNIKTDAESIY